MSISKNTFLISMYCLIAVPVFSQNVYLELNLNNQAIQNRMGAGKSRSPLELYRVIERAANDKRIRGIIVNTAGYTASQETLWELRTVLQKFKAKDKKVCVFISMADLDMYCLASVADKIIMDEAGVLNIIGYSWGKGYVQHTLDKLGIGVRELRYFTFKSASEMFVRDSMSEADRIQYNAWLDDIYKTSKETLINARGWDTEKFNEILDKGFMYSAKEALKQGLVDYTGRQDAIKNAVKELEGNDKSSFVVYGDEEMNLTGAKIYYGPAGAGGLFSRPPVIAVVHANGQTDMEQGMAARSLSHTIRKLAENKRVKAIVLRINSPGGSAEAADYIAEAVKFAKEKVPVVVSMGSVAASGGYWAAMYANEIIASPYTLTGSIGVIGSWFYDKGLNNKLGITVDMLQRGAHADLMTGVILPYRDLKDDEIERYRQLLIDMYDVFVSKVATGRNMEAEKVDSLAQGRVYSGLGALEAGLIDKIGGLQDACASACTLANIPIDKKVLYTEYPKPKFFERMLARVLRTSVNDSQMQKSSQAEFYAMMDILIPEQIRSDILYRISNNGKVMPLLPGF